MFSEYGLQRTLLKISYSVKNNLIWIKDSAKVRGVQGNSLLVNMYKQYCVEDVKGIIEE